jgi:AraC-like DNA-binding protein
MARRMSVLRQQRSVPESFVLMLYEYLDAHGVPAEALLGQPRPVLAAHDHVALPAGLWVALLDRAAQALGDPQLGLKLGQAVTARHMGIVGYLMMACATLGEAMLRLERYQRLIYDISTMRIRSRTGGTDYVWSPQPQHGQERHGPLVSETSLTALAQFCRTIAGRGVRPAAVRFIDPAPRDVQPYLDYFGCPVLFGQPEAGLSFDAATLALTVRTADAAILKLMQQQADRLLEGLSGQRPLVEEVRRHISRMLRDGAPDIGQVAAAMGYSARTLQRQLRDCGSSFRDETAAVRCQLAQACLRDPRLGLVDIALRLGYTEHSAFTRSFQRWTGMTPQAYRQASPNGSSIE